MKRRTQPLSLKALSGALSATMGLSIAAAAFTALNALPAAAQSTTGNTEAHAPYWGVLDFYNTSRYGGPELGRIASDALTNQLIASNRYVILPRQQIIDAEGQREYKAPFNTVQEIELGRDLSAAGVMTGEVASVTFKNNPRRATVALAIRVVDPRNGDLLNGTLAQGVASKNVHPDADDNTLVNIALENAAFSAVERMKYYQPPKATVLIGYTSTIIALNKGARDGLYEGMEMVVRHLGSVTGRIRISNVTSDESDATVIDQGNGIRPEDVATAVYTLPKYSVDGAGLHAKPLDIAYTADHKIFDGARSVPVPPTAPPSPNQAATAPVYPTDVRSLLLFPVTVSADAGDEASRLAPAALTALRNHLDASTSFTTVTYRRTLAPLVREITETNDGTSSTGLRPADLTGPFSNVDLLRTTKIAGTVGTDSYLLTTLQSVDRDPATGRVTVRMSGRVYDSATGAPVRGKTVDLADATTGSAAPLFPQEDPSAVAKRAIDEAASKIAGVLVKNAPYVPRPKVHHRFNFASLLLPAIVIGGFWYGFHELAVGKGTHMLLGGGHGGGGFGGGGGDFPPGPPSSGG